MKFGIKSKLLLAFTTVLMFPLFAGIFSLFTYGLYMERNESITAMSGLLENVRSEIIEHSSTIEDSKQFYEKMKPFLEEQHIDLVIRQGESSLFDSRSYSENERMESSWFLGNELSLQVLLINRDEPLDVTLFPGRDGIPAFDEIRQAGNVLFTSLAVAGLVFLLTVIGWIIYFSKTWIFPLRDVYYATAAMSEGDWQYPIHPRTNDEVGRFLVRFQEMQRQLELSEQQQIAAEQEKQALVASISHDLRTPLASIRGYIEGLEDGVARDEEMRNRYYRVIKEKTAQLEHLIQDLTLFSKLELQQFSVATTLTPVCSFLDEWVAHEMLENTEHFRVSLESKVQEVFIELDAERMKQVFGNLLTNAKQYGASRVVIYTTKHEDMFTVSFHDNGQGIAVEDTTLIFDRFYRVEKSRSRQFGGSGLGLAIVKQIMDAHHGKIEVDSEIGKGSIFSLHFPIMDSPE
ncbi:sensor histidine kinase [Exiguobacterium sp.]|uniref:sensor histidine kinase n=1 Tax=Exiguobacterium sp. TaxID=44751 RepID=UPI00391A1515